MDRELEQREVSVNITPEMEISETYPLSAYEQPGTSPGVCANFGRLEPGRPQKPRASA